MRRENSSQEWSHAGTKTLIEQQEHTYNWIFHYLGVNQDAIEVGAHLGVRADAALTYAPGSSGAAMAAYSTSTLSLRSAVAQGEDVESARHHSAYTAAQRKKAAKS